ncbi:PucR family transcriptional regulator [Diaminobutyricibacter tongyongensis]|uniref:PucR family transcriptional regulator n=1 Tax=Leifsonia tongyongensis TaxID=1268043 RepID=A0A6L9XVB8_9MICO|nr:PucR family transcriptional regulator [Diaminobutyricibacter tongyongensis]NEN04984.1 PucR family transcriptional regulator [Diaminobutyricibacter tongyongensis]
MSQQLDLPALLAHPANGGLRAIATTPAAAAARSTAVVPWRDVMVDSSESRLPFDGTDSLAIVTVDPPLTSWQQDALIRRVRDRGYRALAVPNADVFTPGSRVLAERLGLTLLHADDPMMLAKACWELLEGRDTLTLGYVRRVAQSIEYHANGLADLLRHLSASVGHGVALIDAQGVLLEAGGTLPKAVHKAIDFGRWLDTVTVSDGAAASARVDSPSRVGLRLTFFGTGLSTLQLSALAVAAEVAMPVVAARILIDEVADVNDAAVASGLLREFLERRDSRDAELEQRMLDRGWRTTGYHLGFRVIGRTRVDTFQLLRFVTRELAALPVDSHAATSGRGVTGWLSFSAPPAPSQVENYVTALRGLHAAARRAFNVAAGIGSLESGSAGLVATIDGASDAARIAANRSATGWFVRIDTLGLEQLLLSWTENDTFVPAAESLLAPLITRAPDLLETLTAYLDHESGIAATADALGLHRNTVSTRIARAQELLGLDLSDPEVRLAVHLACRAVKP